jgi:hypothetical protein
MGVQQPQVLAGPLRPVALSEVGLTLRLFLAQCPAGASFGMLPEGWSVSLLWNECYVAPDVTSKLVCIQEAFKFSRPCRGHSLCSNNVMNEDKWSPMLCILLGDIEPMEFRLWGTRNRLER